MSLKSDVKRLEKQLSLSEPDYSEELKRAFAGWTKEELINFIISGVKPDKPVGHISDRLREHTNNQFHGWTSEDLTRYVLTGEKPKKSRL